MPALAHDVAVPRPRGEPNSVSVVIPAHNAASEITEQIDALRAQDRPWLGEVVVVENGSTDATIDVLRGLADEWSKLVIVQSARKGGNVARNAGVRASTSEALVLCDADDIVGASWLDALRSALGGCDVVTGRYEFELLNDEDTVAARGPTTALGPPPAGRPIGGLGGCCGFWRTAFDELDGFSEHHVGSDETEFFLRAHLAGLAVRYEHSAVVHYRLRPSYGGLYQQQKSWQVNRVQLYKEFRSSGLADRRTVLAAIRSWAWLVVHLADARSQSASTRGQWVRVAAKNVGAIRGSIQHRVLYP